MDKANGKIFVVVSWVFILFIGIIIFSFTSYEYITSLAIDDALCYPILAKNIASGNGSTFDGITLTNGYHPLWCWLNIPLALLAKDNMSLLFIFKALLVMVVFIMFFVWFRLLKKIGFTNWAIAIFLLFMGGSYEWSLRVYYSGTETPLVTLFIGLSLLSLMHFHEKPNIKHSILLGFVTAGTFLSRLDSIFFILTLYLFLVYKKRAVYKNVLIALFTFTIISFPYLLWSKIQFGSFMPVSGIKKSAGNISGIVNNIARLYDYILLRTATIKNFINMPVVILLTTCALFFIFIVYYLGKGRKAKNIIWKKYDILPIVYISTTIHFLYNAFFMSEIATTSWHQYLIYLSIYLSIAIFVDTMFTHSKTFHKYIYTIFYVLLMSLMAVVFKYALGRFPRPLSSELVKVAEFARNALPPEAVYGIADPGVFSLVSNRRTIGFNGLVGNRDIMELVLLGRVDKIVEKYNIDYYVMDMTEDELKHSGIKLLYISKKIRPYFPWDRTRNLHNLGYKDTNFIIVNAKEFFKKSDKPR